MSTFNGIVKEFPGIQFDYFRKVDGQQPSLANFLSHIHSDHLTGLAGKGYRAPFIYCSAATKNLLLKLERRLHRFNHAKKLVESHEYSYLDYAKRDRMLRELPLETPTDIELCPGYKIRVTLFDANHCPGSTMFLIEGQGKAIIYTGDIRAESWWLEKLKRNPILLPYFRGIKTLDCLYLDTTHASFEASHLEFSSKADGIADLLAQVSKYPPETVFHLNTWTLGYEDAWVALAAYFDATIHLDDYRLRLFNAIGSKEIWEHGAFLLGRGSKEQILTDDKNVRFHSCERWLECAVRDQAKKEGRLVEISPLVARYKDPNGAEYMLREPGEGGGNVDANAVDEVTAELLLELAPIVKDKQFSKLLQEAEVKPGFILPLDAATPDSESDLNEFIEILKRNLEAIIVARKREQLKTESQPKGEVPALPSWFGYPASRHSSFSELQDLVRSFAPRDVYPCVAADGSWYQKDSIRKLFGKYCTGKEFAFDIERALDLEYTEEDGELNLAEQRAAGMNEESQQARSQGLLHSSPEDTAQGPTQPDDTTIRRRVNDALKKIRIEEPPHATCVPGDTQLDDYDPNDPDIVAKVEQAIEEGKLMSKSILHLNSPSIDVPASFLEPLRIPETFLEPLKAPEKATIHVHFSQDLQQHTISRKRTIEDLSSPSDKQVSQSLHCTESSDIDFVPNSMISKVLETTHDICLEETESSSGEVGEDDMDCTQDTDFGDMNEEKIKEVMKAVEEGRWGEKSKRLEFNNNTWSGAKDDPEKRRRRRSRRKFAIVNDSQ